MEPKIRHLEMIQTAMSRASDNSLRIKGFAMLLLAGTIAFLLRDSVSASNGMDTSTAIIPLPFALILGVFVAILLTIDAYFVRQSDAFRILYNRVRRRSESDIDFSMEWLRNKDDLPEPQSEELSLYIIATIAFYLIILAVLIIGVLPPKIR